MINRLLLDKIKKKNISPFGRIIVVTGARQTGKTTLVRKAFPSLPYISIENPVVVSEYKNLSAAQWNSIYPSAILDEVQKEPQLVESIKATYDQYPETQYILLGSSQILLLKKIRESLAGRCSILEMYPLTLPELMTNSWKDKITPSYFQNLISNKNLNTIPFLLDPKHAEKKEVYDTYLKFGGYPAISNKNIEYEDKREWLKNYVRTYLERDIRDLAELRRLEPFTKVQKLLALNTAQLTNYSKIAVEAGVTSKTVQKFLEYMNISYQTIALQSWSRNSKKRLVKSPKVHYLDIGVMRAILNKNDELNGHEYETAIVAEIYKQAKYTNPNLEFYHLRTVDGREVDLLIESEYGYIAIEIKKSDKVRTLDAKNFHGLDDILDKPILHQFVISNDLSSRQLDEKTIAIPAVQFLS